MLLVGARGFAGSHLAAAAAGAGLRLVAVDRETGEGVPACDLLDPAAVASCVAAVRPDLIVNAAGAASVGRSWQRPAEAFAANATGVLNLLDAVAREAPAAHVLCISSADVYGAREERELPLGEELEPRPLTPYGASKAAMEAVCGHYARGRGLRIGIARSFNLIGPGQSPEFAVSGFARRVAEAERDGTTELRLGLGNPGALRDFLDVRDAARALIEISRDELVGTYNLCSGVGTTIAGLVVELGGVTPLRLRADLDPALERPADPPALVGDPARLREATGFEAAIPLAQSLGDLLDSWRTVERAQLKP
jgi:GDP-4-dehydro-6-deoxy-D-mannose reductase